MVPYLDQPARRRHLRRIQGLRVVQPRRVRLLGRLPRQRSRLRRRHGHRHEHAAAHHLVRRAEAMGGHAVRKHATRRGGSVVPERRALWRSRPPRRRGQLAAHLVRPASDHRRRERGIVLRTGDRRAARLRAERRQHRQPGGHDEHLHRGPVSRSTTRARSRSPPREAGVRSCPSPWGCARCPST